MEIKAPFIQEPVGLGDLVKAATAAVGIEPCNPCIERAKRLNEMLKFAPRMNAWDNAVWPDVPAGWEREATCETLSARFELFRTVNDDRRVMIWETTSGQYKNSKGFCCGPAMEDRIRAEWEKLCH